MVTHPSRIMTPLVVGIVLAIGAVSLASAVTEKVLYSFSGPDGNGPDAGLISDSAGNLYSTTIFGGVNNAVPCGGPGCGVVFELSPTANGLEETVLYNFCSLTNCADGASPLSALTLDPAGNLYGTTYAGGEVPCHYKNGTYSNGCGVVFEVSPNSDGTWMYTVVHLFTGGVDGANPQGPLVSDSAGNLYGTANEGGVGQNGVIFELTKGTDGSWTQTILHAFRGPDGSEPTGSLTLDSSGNLYGTTIAGGGSGTSCGTVGQLLPPSQPGGPWTGNILHSFNNGSDGCHPFSGVVFDTSGALYGTNSQGGTGGNGIVFKGTPTTDGWRGAILHSFTGGPDGGEPDGAPTVDLEGNVYGTAQIGGVNRVGAIYELMPTGPGQWAERAYSFSGPDGAYPQGTPIFDKAGNLYGVTYSGGASGMGTVFEITP